MTLKKSNLKLKEKTYINGTYQVTQYPDGTRVFDDPSEKFEAEFPDNLDVKITDYCDVGCKFCYENSGITGKHCDINPLIEKLSKIPEGVEVTLGGGNPSSHPKIQELIKALDSQGKIVSMTVNEMSYSNTSIPQGLRALGISPIPGEDRKVFEPERDDDLILVYHFIAGIHPISQIEKYLKKGKKVLILGYKTVGRGKSVVPEDLREWANGFKRLKFRTIEGKEFPESAIISVDNLAIEQLDIKNSMTKSEWDLYYLGNDGTHSMYIDAVEGTYSESSTVSKISRISWNNLEIKEYFKDAKTSI